MAQTKVGSGFVATGAVGPTSLSTGAPYWDTSGNIGIGNSSPDVRLKLYGSNTTAGGTETVAKFLNGAGGTATTLIKIGNQADNSSGIGSVVESAGNAATTFYTNTSSVFTERMRIDSSGRVLIGLTSSGSTNSKLQITGGTANATTLATSYSDATVAIVPKSTSGYSLAFASGTGDFPQIQVSANGAAAGDLLIQPYGGNVGIGTSSPSHKLDVVGNLSVGSTIFTGTGVSTGDVALELGSGRSGSGNSYIDFHSTSGTDYEARIIRNGGTNGGLTISNTGTGGFSIQNDGAAQIGFNINGGERMRIDSNGNLLVNRTTVSGLAGTSGHIVLNDSIPSGTLAIGGFGSFLGRQASDGSTVLNTGQGSIIFSRGSYGSTSEAMRIDSSGNLLVGTTNTNPIAARTNGLTTGPVGFLTSRYVNNMALGLSGTSGTHINFYTDNGSTYVAAGNIGSNGSSTSYNTSSDYRLKENIAFLLSGIETIQKLRPVSYTWREGYGNGNGEGFIAHELAEHIPLAVTGEKDAVDDEGNIKPQGVDYSKIVVHLVAAIQELTAKVTALEAKVGS